MQTGWKNILLPLLPEEPARILRTLPEGQVREVRLRLHQPMEVVLPGESRLFYGPNGRGMLLPEETEPLLSAFCGRAVYAWEKELGAGFVTLPAGCRVGITGRVSGREGMVRPVTGFCIRMGREVKGCACSLLPKLLERGRLRSTLLFSVPGGGKTTLLRDIIRLVSQGEAGARGQRVCLNDERFEVSGSPIGERGFDLGPRTDVLGGMEKEGGLLRLLATMSPEILAADELNLFADARGILEARRRGVTVLCTAHGDRLETLCRRRGLQELWVAGAFERYVRLEAPGQMPRVYDGTGKELKE